jgi:UDP-glucose 4-epimerase
MNFSGARVLVTGGAGFIGSHLVDRLLELGAGVMVVDDFSTGREQNLTLHAGDSRLSVQRGDVLDEPLMNQLAKGAEYVFHLATRNVRMSLRQPTIVHDVNATGTLNVLKAAANAKVRRFVYCSSSEVYGTAGVVPQCEAYDFRPETIYGASKLTGEYYTQVFHRSAWLETVVARPHNNYGPREHYRGSAGEVIPRFILWCLAGEPPIIYGDGRQTRDFTYVSETADVLATLALHEQAAGEVFNICRGQEVSVVDLAKKICLLTGASVKPRFLPGRPNDVLRLWGDPGKLQRAIGCKPELSIDEGLTRTIDWFRKHVDLDADVLQSLALRNWEQETSESWMAVS